MEMVVVTGIILLITGMILANSSRLGGQFILDNFAYDLALTLRESQQYGISVQRFNNSFKNAYGMHFNNSSQTTYVMFVDSSTNGIYDAAASPSEIVQSYTITRGYKITNLCATATSGGTEVCSLDRLDIVFKRPEPDALISKSGLSCTASSANCQFSARIEMRSPRNNIRSIVIPNNGQISVQ